MYIPFLKLKYKIIFGNEFFVNLYLNMYISISEL